MSDKHEVKQKRLTNDELRKAVYDFIEKHFGEQVKHSDFSDELIKFISDLIVLSH